MILFLENKKNDKKIGIVTIDSFNFGNKLQNYALQIVLKKFGFEVETFTNFFWSYNLKYYIKKFTWFILQSKGRKFDSFRKLINWSQYNLDELYTNYELVDNYLYFIAGSDQIWNPYYLFNTEAQFLTFAPHQKRISYAASFGINEIPRNKIENYKELLKEITSISVREDAAANIIEDLIGVRPQVVLDPTLLLTYEEWKLIAKKPSFKLPKHYVLKYFLGNSDGRVAKIENYLYDEQGLTIFDVRGLNKFNRELPIGPSEFVFLIQHAACIITDSFHGSVFSTLFKKPFVVFERNGCENNMTSRIDSLCNMFQLNDRRYDNEQFSMYDILNQEYSHIDDILSNERKKSILFLKNSLNIEN